MSSIEELFAEGEADLRFELQDADNFSMRLSSLREKWCRKAVRAELERKRLEMEARDAYVELRNWYVTESPLKIDRRDLDDYIRSNDRYKPHEKMVELANQKVKYISGIIEALDRAGYNVGNAIKWAIFKSGG